VKDLHFRLAQGTLEKQLKDTLASIHVDDSSTVGDKFSLHSTRHAALSYLVEVGASTSKILRFCHLRTEAILYNSYVRNFQLVAKPVKLPENATLQEFLRAGLYGWLSAIYSKVYMEIPVLPPAIKHEILSSIFGRIECVSSLLVFDDEVVG
jgi:hypothetical protein